MAQMQKENLCHMDKKVNLNDPTASKTSGKVRGKSYVYRNCICLPRCCCSLAVGRQISSLPARGACCFGRPLVSLITQSSPSVWLRQRRSDLCERSTWPGSPRVVIVTYLQRYFYNMPQQKQRWL